MPLILRTHGNRFNCPREHQLRNSYHSHPLTKMTVVLVEVGGSRFSTTNSIKQALWWCAST